MKTIDEIKKHLLEIGYDNDTISKISGFLIGSGLKKSNEIITFKIGTNCWDSFKYWYDNDEKVKELSYQSKVIVESLEELILYLDNINDIPRHLLVAQFCFKGLISSIKRSEEHY